VTLAPPRPHSPVTSRSGRGSEPPATVLGRTAAFILRHRKAVIVIWLVLLVAGGMSAGKVQKRLLNTSTHP